MSISKLLTPVTFDPALDPNSIHLNYGFLRHCAKVISPYFNGRTVAIIDQKDNGVLLVDSPKVTQSSLPTKVLLAALKVACLFTIVLPLLALLGTYIFHRKNQFEEKKEEEIQQSKLPVLELSEIPPILNEGPILIEGDVNQLSDEVSSIAPVANKILVSQSFIPPSPIPDLVTVSLSNPAHVSALVQFSERPVERDILSISTLLKPVPVVKSEENRKEEPISLVAEKENLPQVASGSDSMKGYIEISKGDVEKTSNVNEETERLKDYVMQHNSELGFDKVSKLVQEGKSVLEMIWQNPKRIKRFIKLLNRKSPAERQRIVSSIIWALMAVATKKGQGFEQGAFIFEDPENRLFHFLRKLNGSYKRISSHLVGLTPKRHRGFDVEENSEFGLPSGKRHILYTRILRAERIFIKPENFGMNCVYDLTGHTLEFAVSLGRKLLPGVFGSDECPGSCKERIPKDELNRFIQLVSKLEGSAQAIEKVGKNGKGEGISAMYQFLKTLIEQAKLSREDGEAINAFLNELAIVYGRESLPHRIGREVIPTRQEILSL